MSTITIRCVYLCPDELCSKVCSAATARAGKLEKLGYWRARCVGGGVWACARRRKQTTRVVVVHCIIPVEIRREPTAVKLKYVWRHVLESVCRCMHGRKREVSMLKGGMYVLGRWGAEVFHRWVPKEQDNWLLVLQMTGIIANWFLYSSDKHILEEWPRSLPTQKQLWQG